MDDLIVEFLAETNESLATLDLELVRFEKNPADRTILSNIFRLMHTIKGTCGFLGLSRLEHVAHAGEDVLGKFREGSLVATPAAVSLILRAIDQIRTLMVALEREGQEPQGTDAALIDELKELAADGSAPSPQSTAPTAVPLETTGSVVSDGGIPVAAEFLAEIEAWEAAGFKPATPAQIAESLAAEAAREPKDEPDILPPAVRAAVVPANETGQSKDAAIAQQTIRVSVQVLENLMTLVSEMVLTRNNLLQLVRGKEDSEFAAPLQHLSHITTDLQEGVMKTRMQPIGSAWSKLPRIVRDLSVELNKKIELTSIGEETELDRQVLELIRDPLTHMVRNSADHGIETPDERSACGKPETGTITLRAFHEGGHIIIEISDDGRGLNMQKIRKKCIENGLATDEELNGMTDSQIQQFILKPGFSTAEKVTSVSGRGVGMDVVRSNIEQIGGTIQFDSTEGLGSSFTIKIPLTLAIVSALIVKCGGERFAIPQLSVNELVRVSPRSESRVEMLDNARVLRLRDRLLPLVSLREVFHLDADENAREGEFYIVISHIGAHQFGLIVDQVFDTEEIVVKPVAKVLRDIATFSGNTILGDGSVIMILDPIGIAAAAGQHPMIEREPVELKVKQRREVTAFLIFQSNQNERKAVPMALVARLEDIGKAKVEIVAGQRVIQYRGKLMPLISFDPDHVWDREGRQPILVFTDRDRSMGLAVDHIVDIVEDDLKIELSTDKPGIIGSAIIAGLATDVVDVRYYLTQAFKDWFAATRDEDLAIVPEKRLLLVDDSRFFRSLFTPYLSAAGFTVTTAESARCASEILQDDEEFSAIVSDIEMPDIDGFAFATWVRSKPNLKNVPLIALSSHSAKDVVEKGLRSGFDRFVSKEKSEELLSALKAVA